MRSLENPVIPALVLATLLVAGCGTAARSDIGTTQTQVAASIFATQAATATLPIF